jgi:hypothetical protein
LAAWTVNDAIGAANPEGFNSGSLTTKSWDDEEPYERLAQLSASVAPNPSFTAFKRDFSGSVETRPLARPGFSNYNVKSEAPLLLFRSTIYLFTGGCI